MTPIALYPSDASLKKGAAIGIFNIFMGYQLSTWVPDMSVIIPTGLILLGLGLIVQCAWRYAKPRPSFAADADGFSVMGKKKRGWDEYRGAQIHTVRVGFFPAARWVVIKTGKSILGRKLHIKWTHLSSPPKEMAAEIDAYAVMARSETKAPGTLAETFDTAAVRPARLARSAALQQSSMPDQRLFAARLQDAGAGPVQAVPSLTQRLFGRRKVI